MTEAMKGFGKDRDWGVSAESGRNPPPTRRWRELSLLADASSATLSGELQKDPSAEPAFPCRSELRRTRNRFGRQLDGRRCLRSVPRCGMK